MLKLAPWLSLPKVSIVNRNTYLLKLCQAKRVVHLGCADMPHTLELFKAGRLLHQGLEAICAKLAGIDISPEGISLLQSRGVNNLFRADASKLDEIIRMLGWSPEIILAGEILEHLDAPGPLLKELSLQMPLNCILVVTVPNALSLKGLLHVILGHEKVNSDHVSYYSYATMKQLMSRFGFELLDACCYTSVPDNRIERFLDIFLLPIFRIRPYLSDGLIFSCRLLRSDINV